MSIYEFFKGETDMTPNDSFDRAMAMAHRPDCPIDMTDLFPEDIAWVMRERPDCNPGN